MSRRGRQAPNGNTTFIVAPKMCQLNGVFDEMHTDLRVAKVLVRHWVRHQFDAVAQRSCSQSGAAGFSGVPVDLTCHGVRCAWNARCQVQS